MDSLLPRNRMKKITSFFYVFIVLTLSLCSVAFAQTPAPPDATVANPAVIRAEFGLFNRPDSGKPNFVQTRLVPRVINQGYGWVIVLRDPHSKVKFREEFTLPSRSHTFGEHEFIGSQTVSKDGRVSVIEKEATPEQGLIYKAWTVSPGDPRGKYLIRVFVDDALAGVFEFDVR